MQKPSVVKRKGRRGATVKYVDPADGRVRYKHFRTAAAAWDKRQTLIRDPSGGSGHTIASYIEHWLQQVTPTIRAGTARVYASVLRTHVFPVLGPLPLPELRASHVRDLAAGLLRKGLAKKTVGNVVRTLHTVLETAREDRLVMENAAATSPRRRSLLRRTRGERRAKVKAFAPEEMTSLLAAAKAKLDPALWLLFRLMALTGLRPGEAEALQWEDVAWRPRRLHVRRSWTNGRVESTKTGEEREVDLAAVLVQDLKAHDRQVKAAALKRGEPVSKWIFVSGGSDRPVNATVVRDAFKRALKAAGLAAHYSPHSLRHSFASNLLVSHAPVYYVSKQLGHASINITVDVYGSWLPSGDLAVVDGLATRYAQQEAAEGNVTRNVTRGSR